MPLCTKRAAPSPRIVMCKFGEEQVCRASLPLRDLEHHRPPNISTMFFSWAWSLLLQQRRNRSMFNVWGYVNMNMNQIYRQICLGVNDKTKVWWQQNCFYAFCVFLSTAMDCFLFLFKYMTRGTRRCFIKLFYWFQASEEQTPHQFSSVVQELICSPGASASHQNKDKWEYIKILQIIIIWK